MKWESPDEKRRKENIKIDELIQRKGLMDKLMDEDIKDFKKNKKLDESLGEAYRFFAIQRLVKDDPDIIEKYTRKKKMKKTKAKRCKCNA